MEYIKKEELIKGEVYKSTLYDHIFKYVDKYGNRNLTISVVYNKFNKDSATVGNGLDNIINATTEEKHWLNTCIEQDKFITFEEAMKTFIPKYVECIESNTDGFTVNKIYKIKEFFNDANKFMVIDNDLHLIRCPFIGSLWQFKPSTKEAYDAQFIIKEPEFVLPEKWFIKTNLDNLIVISNWFNKNKQNHINDYHSFREDEITPTYQQLCFPGVVKYDVKYHGLTDLDNTYKEITFEQFKKYVLKEETRIEFGNRVDKEIIEPLPQFKVIETIETITKVENNEGNQFFIGDIVKTIADNIYTIKSFEYNVDKSNILAMTDKNTLISIDKIEHYIEPKVEVKEETLLEKAKRLYPIGTKFINADNFIASIVRTNNFINESNSIQLNNEFDEDAKYSGKWTIYNKSTNQWAEIIE